jgi:5'-AMP-activated protein kinase, catalytic alpha subunit
LIYDSETGIVKIIDFGFAASSKEPLKVFCGTPSFMSPEIVCKKEYNGAAADVWALGVVMYVMLCGVLPFNCEDEKGLYRKIQKGSYLTPVG